VDSPEVRSASLKGVSLSDTAAADLDTTGVSTSEVHPSEVAVPDEAGQSSAGRRQRALRGLRGWLSDLDRLRRAALFAVSFATVFITLLVRYSPVLHVVYREDGDFAVNTLSVNRAEHFDQLVGNYSRVGFHHPGPAYFYLLAAGQWLFYRVLHMVPGPYNGQMVIVFAMTAWFVAMTASLLARATRSISAGAVAAGAMVAVTVPLDAFGHMWFPYLYMPMFGLLTLSAAVLASGRLLGLPAYVIAGGFLIQGHVSFISTVGLSTIVVGIVFWLRNRGRLRETLRAHRLGLVVSAVWIVLFAIPMVLELILHYPGPWVQYWKYSTASSPHPLGPSADFFAWYWHRIGVPGWEFALVLLAGLWLLVTETNRDRRSMILSLYGVAVLESAIFFFYVVKGVDKLDASNHYVGFYYLMVPAFVIATVGGHAAMRMSQRRLIGPAIAIGAAFTLFFSVAPTIGLIDLQQGPHPDYLAAAEALETMPGRDGRPVVLESRSWVQLAAVVVQARELGEDVCIGDEVANWSTLFEKADLCHSYQGTFKVELFQNANLGPRPALWTGMTISLTAYGKN
jgi:hypothetical protein